MIISLRQLMIDQPLYSEPKRNASFGKLNSLTRHRYFSFNFKHLKFFNALFIIFVFVSQYILVI